MSSACPFSPFTTPHRAPPGVPTRPLDGPSSSLTDSARCSSVSATASRAHAAPAFVNKVSKVRPFSTTLSLARARATARARSRRG